MSSKGKEDTKDYSEPPTSRQDKYSHADLNQMSTEITKQNLFFVTKPSMLRTRVMDKEQIEKEIKILETSYGRAKKFASHLETALANTKDPEKIIQITRLQKQLNDIDSSYTKSISLCNQRLENLKTTKNADGSAPVPNRHI